MTRNDSFVQEMNMLQINNDSKNSSIKITPNASSKKTEQHHDIDKRMLDQMSSNYGVGDFHFDMTNKQIVDTNYSQDALLTQCEDLKPLGHGSHSKVMMCRYKGNKAVVKIVSQEYSNDPIAQQEFQREVSILARLSHNHILKLYGTGLDDGHSLIILEYLEGGTLKSHLSIRRSFFTRPFTEVRYLRMAREFADALDYLHHRFDPHCMLIHRDLKPDNIGFTASGTLKLLDFGLCIALEKGKADKGVYQLTGMYVALITADVTLLLSLLHLRAR